ncbi:MAG: [Fe-Fe] hydrogenase large subunit C-terminal domain-containing protein [Bacteroidales bacterium]|nr:[Fe-Fe] hydrogenase large subunit C-terminal domain-containing protein [Bacteroidales bacterium]
MPPLISIDKDKCKLCYSCVRTCPAKAIRVQNGVFDILEDLCINCGSCTTVCFQNAIIVKSAKESVKELLKKRKDVIAIVAPSISGEFSDITDYRSFVGMFKSLGFAHVNEISFGADLVALQYLKLLQNFKGKYYISSYCPAVIYYIEKYYPELINNLAPIVTPAVATAKVLHKIHGYGVPIVLITPCFAAKRESDINRQRDSVINYVLSFQEIREMFAEANITENSVSYSEFDPPIAYKGSLFPISRGILQAVDINEDLLTGRILCTTGRDNFISVIQEFKAHVEIKQHLDLLYCDGCIMGPGMSKGGGKYLRRSLVINYVEKRLKNFVREQWESEIKEYSALDLSRTFNTNDNQKTVSPDENVIKSILHKLGKSTKEEIIGCSACGYENCKEFAKFIYFGYASPEMCRQYVYEKMRTSVEKLAFTNEELSNTKAKLIASEQKARAEEAMAEEVSDSLRSMLKKIHVSLYI